MAAPTILRVVEREFVVWRRLWRATVFSAFLSPVLYLAAMGLGLGDLVDQGAQPVKGMTYLEFVSPGLLAASAGLLAAGESMWAVLAGLKWLRTFHAAVATPVQPSDVFGGRLLWVACRVAMSSCVFLVVAALFGGIPSAWGILAVPAAVLGAAALSAPLQAFAATQETDVTFPVVMRLGVLPLFLFSGTFFPVDRLPDWLQPLCWLSPLWHAAELCRAATTGMGLPAWEFLAHVAILAAFVAAGWVWGVRTFTRRLSR